MGYRTANGDTFAVHAGVWPFAVLYGRPDELRLVSAIAIRRKFCGLPDTGDLDSTRYRSLADRRAYIP